MAPLPRSGAEEETDNIRPLLVPGDELRLDFVQLEGFDFALEAAEHGPENDGDGSSGVNLASVLELLVEFFAHYSDAGAV